MRPSFRWTVPVLLAAALASCQNGGLKTETRRDKAPAPAPANQADLFTADYRYAPPSWQTCIGLPDDWQKTLVSKEGVLLYDYIKGNEFGTRVSVGINGAAETVSAQAMADPRVPIVETVLSDKGGRELMRETALAVVPGDDQKLPLRRNTKADEGRPARGDLLLIKKTPGRHRLALTIESKDPLDLADRTITRKGRRFIGFSAGWTGIAPGRNKLTVTFPERVEELAVYCASGHEAGDIDFAWAKTQPDRSARYWAAQDFPYGVMAVSDPAMQGLLDSCIRNIYQAREIKDGLPIFQVGPTCYRGLWVVDGAFILEAMTYLGRGQEARAGIRHLLTRRKPDGSFDILGNYWKENGIVLYILTRHALLTGDAAWLKENWATVAGVVNAIKRLRRDSRKDPAALEAGLIPPGFPDGGIDGVVPEYTNVYWSLAGLKAAVEAARRLGMPELSDWEAEFKDFWATFQKAAQRDRKPMDGGLFYLPILMTPREGVDPVRGQWGFCHAVFPGRLFEAADPLALGTLKLLDGHQQEGLVLGTGWMADGIWNYFASFWAHAHLWLGQGEQAAEILYAYANHASPLRAWREEQPPKGVRTQAPFVGDMPHNWASAELIRLVRNLLVLERGNELHLLEGLPRPWLKPGAKTALNGAATDFGPLTMTLEAAADGATARLVVVPPADPELRRIVVHLGAWAAEGRIEPKKTDAGWEWTIPLTR
jgi:hypothetical protein